MSRLDSVIRRLSAQRAGLNWAAEQLADTPGDLLELGLGNGRTYDHLRSLLPDRRIWVIDRHLNCHPDCIPPEADFLQGDADAMLIRLAEMGVKLTLAHYDLGTGVPEQNVAMAKRLAPLLAQVMHPGGLILSDQSLPAFEQLPEPCDIPKGRYMFYRATEG